jgi:hypothetical protein
VAVLAPGLNQFAVGSGFSQEVARKTDIVVDRKVLVPFEVAMARAARDYYSIYNLGQMMFVSKLDTVVVDLLGCDFLNIVTFRPQTGGVYDGRARLGTDPADRAIDGLGQPIDLAFNETGKAGLQMAFQTVDIRMPRRFPARIIGVHDVTGIAEPGLTGQLNRADYKKACKNSQQQNPCRPLHSFDNIDR